MGRRNLRVHVVYNGGRVKEGVGGGDGNGGSRRAAAALAAFETLLTLRILARRARLTPLCSVENDDITIKLPSAYGN